MKYLLLSFPILLLLSCETLYGPAIGPIIEEGDEAFQEKNYQKAIGHYSHAIFLVPTYPEAYEKRAWTYFVLKEYDKAIGDYDKAISKIPNNEILYNNRGFMYLLLGKFDMALKDFETALNINPKLTIAIHNRSLAILEKEFLKNNLNKKDIEDLLSKLESDYSNALLYENDEILYMGRGLIYLFQNRLDKAENDANKALSLNPDLQDAYMLLALIYEKKGDNEKAKYYYERTKKKDISSSFEEEKLLRQILEKINNLK